MPPKARPAAKDVDRAAESSETSTATAAGADATESDSSDPVGATDVDGVSATGNDDAEPETAKPGLYRFTWPYSCTYNLPGQVSKEVEPGDEVFWPGGAPDALWEFVSDEPAPAASDNT